MSDPSPHTTQLHQWVERMRAGDAAAENELLRSVWDRLEALAHRMLQGFPHVRSRTDADDVLQSALLRLLRALKQVRPGSMREFFGLAAEQVRRELLDLARYFRPRREESLSRTGTGGLPSTVIDPMDRVEGPDEIDKWCRFHEEVGKLPTEEREVVGLLYYHGWKQADVAAVLQTTVRTVQRRWQSAMLKLHGRLKEERSTN